MLTAQDILLNKNNIYICAKTFREDANALMILLAQEFNFNINNFEAWPIQVYKTRHNNKETLKGDWTFYLHGAHCRFDNSKTGQIVEVRHTEKPEFGFLDGFFLFNYMQTTDKFKILATYFENHLNVYKAIDTLSNEGILTKKPGLISGSYVIAL
jgi:hypothetical protein